VENSYLFLLLNTNVHTGAHIF